MKRELRSPLPLMRGNRGVIMGIVAVVVLVLAIFRCYSRTGGSAILPGSLRLFSIVLSTSCYCCCSSLASSSSSSFVFLATLPARCWGRRPERCAVAAPELTQTNQLWHEGLRRCDDCASPMSRASSVVDQSRQSCAGVFERFGAERESALGVRNRRLRRGGMEGQDRQGAPCVLVIYHPSPAHNDELPMSLLQPTSPRYTMHNR